MWGAGLEAWTVSEPGLVALVGIGGHARGDLGRASDGLEDRVRAPIWQHASAFIFLFWEYPLLHGHVRHHSRRLIGWLNEAQRKEKLWKRRFYRLFHDIGRWHEHLENQKNPEAIPEGESPEQTKRRTALSRLWGLPEEILNVPDPLAAIIEKNKPDPAEDEDHGLWGW